MSNSENPEKKIIVDEDWKAQAQAEKEKLVKKIEEAEAEKSAAGTADTAGKQDQPKPESGVKWPEPSLELLVTTLATQAMVALGLIADPLSGKPKIDAEQAKHFIGTLEMLQEKTEGNLTKEESEMLSEVLHQLRMGFVAVNRNS